MTLPRWPRFGRVAVDIETHDPYLVELGPGFRRGARVVGVSFAIEGGPSAYLPIGHQTGENMDEEAVVRYLKDQAEDFRGEIVGANLSYDLDGLASMGVIFREARFLDVQVAEPLLDENQFTYSLDAIASRWGLEGKDEKGLEEAAAAFGWTKPKDVKANLWRLDPRHVGPYAERDARLPLELIRLQEREIRDQSLERVWRLECDLLPALVKMRRRGVRVDWDRLDEVEEWATTEIHAACAEVSRISGRRFVPTDITKARAIGDVYDAVGIELQKTKNGLPTKRKDYLSTIDHPVTPLLLRAMRFDKNVVGFARSIRRYQCEGRIHPTFNQLKRTKDDGSGDERGTIARLSSTDCNIQQQPGRDPEIGPRWRSIYVPDEGGEWAALDFSCYDEDTEILTPDGWVLFPYLRDGQEVAQWDQGRVAYVVPSKVHRHDFEGEMIRIQGVRQVDFLVTPNHDCVIRTRKGEDEKLRAERWGDRPTDAVLPQSGTLYSDGTENENLIRLIVALQADSSRRANSYRFFLSKSDKIKRLEFLLEGREHTRGFCEAKSNQTWFDVRDGWDIDKYLGPFKTFRRRALLSLSPELRRVFLDELLLWDGNKKSKIYQTTNMENAEIVQEIAVLTGYRSNLTAREPSENSFGKKIQFFVTLNPKTGTIVKSIESKKESYCGKVYCVTVPSGAVIVRRNGRVGVSGNSQEPRWTIAYAEMCKLPGAAEAAQAYRDDPRLDHHAMMARMIWPDWTPDQTERRSQAKAIFLGLCYGMGSGKLARQLGLPSEMKFIKRLRKEVEVAGPEGRAIIDKFDRGVPFVRALFMQATSKAEERGYVCTILGRRARFPIRGRSRIGVHKALNRIIQGSAADQTKRAMVLADKEGIKMQLQVHDEICLTVYDHDEARRLAEMMENAIQCRVPHVVEPKIGRNWGETK